MREREIEKHLIRQVERHSGLAVKFISPGRSGIPDRVVLAAKGRLAFVELKAPGEKLRPIQQRRKEELEALGFMVRVIDRYSEVDSFIEEFFQ